jgi:hypothetical protein
MLRRRQVLPSAKAAFAVESAGRTSLRTPSAVARGAALSFQGALAEFFARR